MTCPYLIATDRIRCMAARAAYQPSDRDRRALCMCGDHRKCPLYCNVEADGSADLTKLDLWTFGHIA